MDQSIALSSSVTISATGGGISSKVWLQTDALSQQLIDRLTSIQIEAHGDAVPGTSHGSFAVEEIIILDSPKSIKPKNIGGIQMVWTSYQYVPKDTNGRARSGIWLGDQPTPQAPAPATPINQIKAGLSVSKTSRLSLRTKLTRIPVG